MRRNLNGNVKSNVKFKFRVGDRARIIKSRRTFKKGYLPDWTGVIFTICKRIIKESPIYRLTDNSGEILEGSFYEEELHKVIKEESMFRIENILRRKEKRKKEKRRKEEVTGKRVPRKKRRKEEVAGKMERVPRKVQ